MKKNKNVILVEKDVEIAKGVFLSEGDAFVKTRGGWTLVEAEGDDEEKKDDDEENVEESEDDDKDDEDKKEESKADDDKMAKLRAKKK
jgi:hypothetical protein